MATVASPTPGASLLKPKYVLFGLIGLMIAYVLVHDESFLFRPQDPVWQHYHPFRWYLLPHGLAGACVILLGPLQFSNRLRRRYTALHRATGRIYIAAAMVLAPLGAYIQFFEESMGEPRSFTVATLVDAVLLMATTGIAFAFILKRKVQQHREWMTRSYAVALVFVEVRVIGGLTGWDIETIVWSCVGLALLVGDITVQAQNWPRSAPTRRAG
jgi:uncharacterized membrane protein